MEVMERMEERIILLKVEVEGRGYLWSDEEPRNGSREVNGDVNGDGEVNGDVNGDREVDGMHIHRNTSQGAVDLPESTGHQGGRMGDEELRRSLRAQLDEVGDDEGVHL